ncbi:nitrogen metabolism-related protein, partial [Auriculariales sp. MPI-PUGE-AT-0066]
TPTRCHLQLCDSSRGAPESINSLTDGVLSANTVFRVNFGGPVFARTVKERSYVDAIVIACFSPHPLVPMLRENHPGFIVIGIYEAAVQTAAQMGLRFGIVTTGAQWESILMHALEYSTGVCKDRCVGVKGTGVAVLALDHSDETRTALLNSSLELLRAGAEAIILGCAGMSPLAKQLQDDILKASPWRSGLSSQYVPIIDGVRAAIEIAASLARQAL